MDPPINQQCKNLSLDISFICLSKEIIKKIEKKLKKYHISINQILDAGYVYKFSNSTDIPFVEMASKIIDGYNKNEVKLVNKTQKNKGFFEKFFDLFSWLYFIVIFLVFEYSQHGYKPLECLY